MSVLAGELLIKMGLDVAQLRRDSAESSRLAKDQAAAWSSATSVIKGGLAAIVAQFTLDKVISSFHEATSALSALDDAAEITGASVESLSGLMGVAAEAGVGLAGLTSVMQQLTKATLGTEQESSKAAAAFKLLKIDPREFSDQADLLVAVARGFDGYAEGARKSELAQALLGKGGQQYLPLLKDLAEKGTEQGKITSEMAAEAERLEKQWARLSYEGSVFRQTIVSKIIPSLADLITQFNQARKAGLSFWESLGTIPGANATKDNQIDLVKKQLDSLTKKRDEIAKGGPMQDFFKADRIEAANKAIAEHTKILGVLQTQKTTLQKGDKDLEGVYGFGARPGRVEVPNIFGDKKGVATVDPIIKKQAEAITDMTRAMTKFGEESSIALTYFEVTQGKYKEFDATTKKQLIGIANQTDERKRFFEQEKKIVEQEYEMGKVLEKQTQIMRERDQAAIDGVLKQTPTAIIEEKRKLQDLIDNENIAGRISDKQADEATNIINGLKKVDDGAKKTKDVFEELGATFESSFERAISKGADFSEFMSAMAKDITKILAREFITGPIITQFKQLIEQIKNETKILGAPSSSGPSLLSSLWDIGKNFIFGSGSSDPGGSFSEGNYQSKSVIVNIDSRSDAATVKANAQAGVAAAMSQVAEARYRGNQAYI